ncbi:hypothetical protein EJB05_27459, partial [Eragrostis curvula]
MAALRGVVRGARAWGGACVACGVRRHGGRGPDCATRRGDELKGMSTAVQSSSSSLLSIYGDFVVGGGPLQSLMPIVSPLPPPAGLDLVLKHMVINVEKQLRQISAASHDPKDQQCLIQAGRGNNVAGSKLSRLDVCSEL